MSKQQKPEKLPHFKRKSDNRIFVLVYTSKPDDSGQTEQEVVARRPHETKTNFVMNKSDFERDFQPISTPREY